MLLERINIKFGLRKIEFERIKCELSEDEQAYVKYFQISSIKKRGDFIEAKV